MAKENFTSYHSTKMQSVPRDTRRAVLEAQMSYDAVVILRDGKMRQLTGASRKIFFYATGRHRRKHTSARR